jgi:aspartyl-tRNA(Asn)/glutamyl-tRNA(Gln) amidotransferase subunit C
MLTKEEVKHIAALARIGLNDGEIEKFSKEISSILDWVEQLKEVDVSGVEPTAHITGMKNIDRKDEVEEFGSLGREAILRNAPEVKNGSIKVKSIL